jgi:hypothetical protein
MSVIFRSKNFTLRNNLGDTNVAKVILRHPKDESMRVSSGLNILRI